MKLIARQILLLAGAVIALYAVLLGLSLLLVSRADIGDRLDTARAAASLYLTEPKYVFLARARLDTTADKILLVGASNTQAGFKQPELQALVPNAEVHNLAVGGSNIKQVGQIVESIREVQSPQARRHNTYVVGLWYGVFASDRARWFSPDRTAGDTDIDIERYRYGFYRRTDAGPVPLLPPGHLDAGVLLIHPYLVLDRAARDMTRSLRDFMAAKKPAITDDQRNAIVLSDADKRRYLAFWRDYTDQADAVDETSFALLAEIVDRILDEGGHVVLVDLSIPQWHAQGSALAADYRRHIDPLLAQLQARKNVAVLKMGDGPSDDFGDEVHPKPRVTAAWARQLAAVLLAQQPPKTFEPGEGGVASKAPSAPPPNSITSTKAVE